MLAVCKLVKGSTGNISECPQNLQMRPREKKNVCVYVGFPGGKMR